MPSSCTLLRSTAYLPGGGFLGWLINCSYGHIAVLDNSNACSLIKTSVRECLLQEDVNEMLSKEDNAIITHVGPGTPMGNLLRRYWTPACLSSEIPDPDCTPLRVRLLGEDLVAFRDTEGRVGLIDVNCPHRGTSLFFGRNEESGLRCVYHGWKFDVNRKCVDMTSEPPTR